MIGCNRWFALSVINSKTIGSNLGLAEINEVMVISFGNAVNEQVYGFLCGPPFGLCHKHVWGCMQVTQCTLLSLASCCSADQQLVVLCTRKYTKMLTKARKQNECKQCTIKYSNNGLFKCFIRKEMHSTHLLNLENVTLNVNRNRNVIFTRTCKL